MNENIVSSLLPHVGRSGIFIEKGFFETGVLQRVHLERQELVEIDVALSDGTSLQVACISVEISCGALKASGYVSNAWIFEESTVEAILAQTSGKAEAAQIPMLERYRFARRTIDRRTSRDDDA